MIKRFMDTPLFKQLFNFVWIGFLTFFIDYGCLNVSNKVLSLNLTLSVVCGFIISTVVNYLLNTKFTFTTQKTPAQFVGFVLLSVIGLGLTEVIMHFATGTLGLNNLFAKVISTGIVMVYNFITKKLFLERKTYGIKRNRKTLA